MIRLHTNKTIRFNVNGESVNVSSHKGDTRLTPCFLFFIAAFLRSLEFPVDAEIPMYRTCVNGKVTNTPWNETRAIPFEMAVSFFADDGVFISKTLAGLTVVTQTVYDLLSKLGLQMHVGTDSVVKSKSEFMHVKHSVSVPDGASRIEIVGENGEAYHVNKAPHLKILGSIISEDASSTLDVHNRITCAVKAFGAFKGALTNPHMDDKVRGLLYVAVIMTILFYGGEVCKMTAVSMNQLRTFHHSCVRKMCRVNRWGSRHQRITTVSLLARLGLQKIEFYYNLRLLRWAGHLARMPLNRLPRKFLTGWYPAPRHQHWTWGTILNRQLLKTGISDVYSIWSNLAQDRTAWKNLIYSGSKSVSVSDVSTESAV
jgi:hypothetical protein